jgi:hypothetical protein
LVHICICSKKFFFEDCSVVNENENTTIPFGYIQSIPFGYVGKNTLEKEHFDFLERTLKECFFLLKLIFEPFDHLCNCNDH